MKAQIIQKKKNTGRSLVLLNAGITQNSLFKAAKNSSLRLAHFHDYLNNPVDFLQAFLDGDGIYFGSLNVAVINLDKEDRLEHLNRTMSHKSVLFIEPERYVYEISSLDYLKGYRDGINSLLENLNQRAGKGDVAGQEVMDLGRRFTDSDKATWGIKATGVPESPYSGKGINIAVLDTGVFKDHVDLAGRKITTKKFVSSGSAGDADGHGSHCVGVSCGFTNEAGMRYGVAHKAKIFCGKVLNDNGEGTDAGILAGIEWAIAKKCRVISMSLGAPTEVNEPYSETYENVAMRSMKKGSLIIAAAGNESNRPDLVAPVGHPANCPSIMAVGAVDSLMKIAYFSCGGINKNGGQVDIVAPGVSVYSMINVQHEHEKWDGTSMATPFVAGIAGLYCEQNIDATPQEIWSLITQHAKRLSLSSIDGGSGLVQAPQK